MNRRKILEKLLNYEESIENLKKNLNNLSWDSNEELVFLDSNHLKHMFNLFISGQISENILEEWANLIESREDIGFNDNNIEKIIFELANPILFGKINIDKIKNYYSFLQ